MTQDQEKLIRDKAHEWYGFMSPEDGLTSAKDFYREAKEIDRFADANKGWMDNVLHNLIIKVSEQIDIIGDAFFFDGWHEAECCVEDAEKIIQDVENRLDYENQ